MGERMNFTERILATTAAAGLSLGVVACAENDNGGLRATGYKAVPVTAGEALALGDGHNGLQRNINTTTTIEGSVLDSVATTESSTTTSSTVAPTTEAPTTTFEVVDYEEVLDYFTVDTTKFACVEDGGATGTVKIGQLEDGSLLVLPKYNSILPIDETVRTEDNRFDTDFMANPLTADLENKEDSAANYFGTLCEDPINAVTAAHKFANIQIGDKTLADANDWLAKYKGDGPADTDMINDWAAEFTPGLGKSILTAEEEADAIAANQAHQELAENLIELFSRLENLGVKQDLTTVSNYHLANALVLPLPEVGLNDQQYTGDFLVFAYTFKDGRDCLISLGVNVDDQRLADVAMENCEEALPPTTTTQPGETTTTAKTGTTTTQPDKTTTTTQPDKTTTTTQPDKTTTTTTQPEKTTTTTTQPEDTTTTTTTTQPEKTTTTTTTTTTSTLPDKKPESPTGNTNPTPTPVPAPVPGTDRPTTSQATTTTVKPAPAETTTTTIVVNTEPQTATTVDDGGY